MLEKIKEAVGSQTCRERRKLSLKGWKQERSQTEGGRDLLQLKDSSKTSVRNREEEKP